MKRKTILYESHGIERLHPNNPFKHNPIDYKYYIKKYPALLRNGCVENQSDETVSNSSRINWQDSNIVKLFTLKLLENYFNLHDINIPDDALCPALPNRMNYICWIESLCSAADACTGFYTIDASPIQQTIVDIGVGSIGIYPLLACRYGRDRNLSNYCFVGSDIDIDACRNATLNVKSNQLMDKIAIHHVEDSHVLQSLLYDKQRVLYSMNKVVDCDNEDKLSNEEEKEGHVIDDMELYKYFDIPMLFSTLLDSYNNAGKVSEDEGWIPMGPVRNVYKEMLKTYCKSSDAIHQSDFTRGNCDSSANIESKVKNRSSLMKAFHDLEYEFIAKIKSWCNNADVKRKSSCLNSSDLVVVPSESIPSVGKKRKFDTSFENSTDVGEKPESTSKLISSSTALQLPIYACCLTNPPFYDTKDTVVANAHSICTGNTREMHTIGGEVMFVIGMIVDSLILRRRFRWYTAMVGKKSSLRILQRFLVACYKIDQSISPCVTTKTALIQGATTRWCIGWSFYTKSELNSSSTNLHNDLELIEVCDLFQNIKQKNEVSIGPKDVSTASSAGAGASAKYALELSWNDFVATYQDGEYSTGQLELHSVPEPYKAPTKEFLIRSMLNKNQIASCDNIYVVFFELVLFRIDSAIKSTLSMISKKWIQYQSTDKQVLVTAQTESVTRKLDKVPVSNNEKDICCALYQYFDAKNVTAPSLSFERIALSANNTHTGHAGYQYNIYMHANSITQSICKDNKSYTFEVQTSYDLNGAYIHFLQKMPADGPYALQFQCFFDKVKHDVSRNNRKWKRLLAKEEKYVPLNSKK